MDYYIWIGLGIGIIAWSFYMMFMPPKKHKTFDYTDMEKARNEINRTNMPD